MRILAIDDNTELVALIKESLTIYGYEVLTATDGVQGIAIAKAEKPDLIILDIMMPGTNGIEVSKRLKADPATANIPIIFLTVLKDREERKGPDLAPNIVLAKPLSLTELIQAIEAALH